MALSVTERVQPKKAERAERSPGIDAGNIAGLELRFHGTPRDIGRVLEACKRAMTEAESRGDLEGSYIVIAHVDN